MVPEFLKFEELVFHSKFQFSNSLIFHLELIPQEGVILHKQY